MNDVVNGVTIYELQDKLEYTERGETKQAESLLLVEPCNSSYNETLRLSQLIRQANAQGLRAFFGDNWQDKINGDEDKSGEEVLPFHLQKQPEEKEISEQVQATTEFVMTSNINPSEFINVGKKLLTNRYSGTGNRRLCTVDDDSKTALTGAMFDEMNITDKINLIVRYCVFFAISSIGNRRNISS